MFLLLFLQYQYSTNLSQGNWLDVSSSFSVFRGTHVKHTDLTNQMQKPYSGQIMWHLPSWTWVISLGMFLYLYLQFFISYFFFRAEENSFMYYIIYSSVVDI